MAAAPAQSTLGDVRPGRRNLVVGLGRTGVSCARWLAARGERVRVVDSRETPPGLGALEALFSGSAAAAGHIEFQGGGLDPALLAGVERVVLSPGVARREPLVAEALARGLPVLGDVELFARAVRAPAVAITGTNGKSTVTTLVAEMANAAGITALAGGNLGEPALELLERPRPDLYVLELSSFQLESTDSLELVAGAVLNLSADHLDRYDSLAEYGAAKARILAHAATAVVNLDDPVVARMPRGGQRVHGFALEHTGAEWRLAPDAAGRGWLVRGGERLLALDELRLPGRHNAANALAALAVCAALELPLAPQLEVLRRFAGLPHRMQWVADRRGVRFVDDSKGTNVGATLAAVAGLDGPLVLVAGGDGKNQDFQPLAAACRGKVRLAVLIGRDAPRLEAALAGACPTERAADMDAAVESAARAAVPGDLVLLSPACASLDMFRDYVHRGECFAEAVRRLRP